MKKHNEGYTLVLVLMVMLVLGLLSTAVLTASLRNMKLQQSIAQRVSDKYEAQGMIEEVIAQLTANNGGTVDLSSDPDNGRQIMVYFDTIAVSVRAGQVQIDCLLALEGQTPVLSHVEYDTYSITGLQQIKYLSYEISTAEEVPTDVPEDYVTEPEEETTE